MTNTPNSPEPDDIVPKPAEPVNIVPIKDDLPSKIVSKESNQENTDVADEQALLDRVDNLEQPISALIKQGKELKEQIFDISERGAGAKHGTVEAIKGAVAGLAGGGAIGTIAVAEIYKVTKIEKPILSPAEMGLFSAILGAAFGAAWLKNRWSSKKSIEDTEVSEVKKKKKREGRSQRLTSMLKDQKKVMEGITAINSSDLPTEMKNELIKPFLDVSKRLLDEDKLEKQVAPPIKESPPTEKIELGNGVTLEMVALPGGKFMMGAPESEKHSGNRERPQHKVTIQPFFMGKFRVTQAQWKEIAYLPKVDRDLNPDPSNFKGDNRPVENVNWYEAVEFCKRLSLETACEYRLPSEAEWEYACRDAFGLSDMHGNVFEWCADNWHENYKGAPKDGSAWLAQDSNVARVIRGGCWVNYSAPCRSAYRDFINPDDGDSNLGFRVVCDAPRTL